ncbi:IS3 family transposase [Blastopirellula retiformator]|uniref:IS3 family transposase n=1 Tax=Blastopirellula retiformator TaxID=2527970 RepID=UPI001FE64ADF|nr:IS3 family transposase [Blastopirellula retiformator]
MANAVRRHEERRGEAAEIARRREQPAETDHRRSSARHLDAEGDRQGKLTTPQSRREAVKQLQENYSVSERRACRVLDLPRSSQRFEGKPRDEDARLTKRILELVRERPRWGYRQICQLLRREGETLNMKKMHRLWKAAGLKVPQKRRKKRATGVSTNACHVQPASFMHDVWTWDFIQSSTIDGRTIRFLNIVDEYTRQCLTIKVGRSITSEDAIDTLAELFSMHGVPKRIRCDNGPEFISCAIKTWLVLIGVEVLYIEPGSPWQNGFCESFNSRLRDEYLHQTDLRNEEDARIKARAWREDFNERRPHSSLGYLTPSEFARRCAASTPVAALLPLQRHSDPTQSLPVSQTDLS